MTTALILIDIQNDYFPGGAGELYNPIEASLRARQLLDHFRQAHLPLVHIQHVAIRPGAKTFLPGTVGVEIHENVRPLEEDRRSRDKETQADSHHQATAVREPFGDTHVVICG